MKLLKKQFDIKLIHTALVFALIYCVLFNSSVVLYKYGNFKASFFSSVFELSIQFICAYITTFLFFLGLTINRSVFVIGAVFLFVTGAIASYYLFRFGAAPTLKTMPLVFNANTKQISTWLSVKLVIWIVFGLVICFFGIKHFNPQPTRSFVSKIIAVLCLFLTINNIISPQFKILRTYFPTQYLSNTYRYFFTNHDISKKGAPKQKNNVKDTKH